VLDLELFPVLQRNFATLDRSNLVLKRFRIFATRVTDLLVAPGAFLQLDTDTALLSLLREALATRVLLLLLLHYWGLSHLNAAHTALNSRRVVACQQDALLAVVSI